jgi:hypothetical protein
MLEGAFVTLFVLPAVYSLFRRPPAANDRRDEDGA